MIDTEAEKVQNAVAKGEEKYEEVTKTFILTSIKRFSNVPVTKLLF